MSHTAAAAAALASTESLRVCEDMQPHAAEARAPSLDGVELGLTLQPLVIASAWWLLIAVAVIQGLAE